jgi:hypothetical protein
MKNSFAEPGTSIQRYDEAQWAENQDLAYEVLEVSHSIANS